MKKVPVRIRGVDYPSIRAAAKALNVHMATVCYALDRGTINSVGLHRKRDFTDITVTVPNHKADGIRALIMEELAK